MESGNRISDHHASDHSMVTAYRQNIDVMYLFVCSQIVDVPVYSDLEYQQHLHDEGWTRQETDHLFDLCKRFDIRFIVVHDRWDKQRYRQRSVEDLKERYYSVCNTLTKVLYFRGYNKTPPVLKILKLKLVYQNFDFV